MLQKEIENMSYLSMVAPSSFHSWYNTYIWQSFSSLEYNVFVRQALLKVSHVAKIILSPNGNEKKVLEVPSLYVEFAV